MGMETLNDEEVIGTLHPEAPAVTEREGYEVRLINSLTPAWRHRSDGEWSATGAHNGRACVTFLAWSFEEVVGMYERHEAGDTSLCGKLPLDLPKPTGRELAELAAWRELNSLAIAGDVAAEAEVVGRAGVEPGRATPVYDRLLDKHLDATTKRLAMAGRKD